MANKSIDLTGKRFGMLTVLSRSERKDNHGLYWICRCDCGREKEVRGDNLKNGTAKSCGCTKKINNTGELPETQPHVSSTTTLYNGVIYVVSKDAYRAGISYRGKNYQLLQSKKIDDCIAIRKEAETAIENGNFLEWYKNQRQTARKKSDLTGKRFGMLTVIGRSNTRAQYWICQCDCGNTKEFNGSKLRKGFATSCGCDRKAAMMIGRTSGKLTVLRESDQRKGYWLCQCECGNTKEVRENYLRSGLIKSCGCLRGKWKHNLRTRKRGEIPRTKNRIYYEGETKPNGTTATGVSTHSTGFKIQYLRERRNKTAEDLCKYCNVTRAAVNHWEQNRRFPDDKTLQIIADALKVDVAALLERNIRSIVDVIHILFEIAEDGCIVPDADGIQITNDILRDALAQWYDKHEQWKSGQITNEEYYDWQDAFTVADLSEKENRGSGDSE